MVELVHLWRDSRGYLHETQQSAIDADELLERETRREIVKQMLVTHLAKTTRGDRAEAGLFASTADAAEWLIENWPVIRPIGFAYRVHELAGLGEMAIPPARPSTFSATAEARS